MDELMLEGWRELSGLPGFAGPARRVACDHLLVGPGGVAVIDSALWVGQVEVSRGVLQQNGFWREQECAAVARTAGLVASLLEPHQRTAVHAVIVPGRTSAGGDLVAPGVRVAGPDQLARVLRALPVRFTPEDVLQVGSCLADAFGRFGGPVPLTTAELDTGDTLPGLHRVVTDPRQRASLFGPVATGLLGAGSAPRRQARRRPARSRTGGPRPVRAVRLVRPARLRAARSTGPRSVASWLLPWAVGFSVAAFATALALVGLVVLR